MFFTMLRQSFFEGGRRKLLAVLTVALAAALITTLLNLSVDVGDKMAHELKSYGANIRVTAKSESIPLEIGGIDYNPLKGRGFLAEEDLPLIKDIFWRNNILGLAPFLNATVVSDLAPDESLSLVGTYFDRTMPIPDDEEYRTGVVQTNSFWEVEGAWPDDETTNQALAGKALAERLGLKVGDTVRLRLKDDGPAGPREVTITGVLKSGGTEDNALLAPLALVQEMTGLGGRVQSVNVSALTIPENELSRKARRDVDALSTTEYDVWYCTAYVSSIAHQIEEAVVNASARPIWQVAASEGVVIGKIQLLMLVVTLAAFVSSAMGISSLMNTAVMERAREIGLMKSLGAMKWEIHALFLSEAAIIGVIGGLVGCLIGTGLSQVVGLTVFDSYLSLHWISLPVVVFASIAVALAGSVVPSLAVARLMPVEVFHGRQ